MSKETFDPNNPHVNVGTIGYLQMDHGISTAMGNLHGGPVGKLHGGEVRDYDAFKHLSEEGASYIPEPERATDKPFLMPIEDVVEISGRGTVATGRVEQGKIRVGEEVEIVGIRDTIRTTCDSVEMFRKLLDEGVAGDNVGVLLRRTKKGDVEKGQVLAAPGSITPHTKFEAEEMVNPGDNLTITVDLMTPIAMNEGLRFAIREEYRTVGAGQVTKILD